MNIFKGKGTTGTGTGNDNAIVKKEKIRRAKLLQFGRIVRTIFVVLTLVALVTLVLFSLVLNAFRIERNDMSLAIEKGDIVISAKKKIYVRDDIIAFYHNNDIFIKRIAAVGGDEVIIDEDGALYVNGVRMEEEYVVNSGTGFTDITFPFIVPEGKFFVLGDNREVSEDSRMQKVGAVTGTLIIGKVIFTVWPFSSVGIVK